MASPRTKPPKTTRCGPKVKKRVFRNKKLKQDLGKKQGVGGPELLQSPEKKMLSRRMNWIILSSVAKRSRKMVGPEK